MTCENQSNMRSNKKLSINTDPSGTSLYDIDFALWRFRHAIWPLR
jgi:hypothetical protein